MNWRRLVLRLLSSTRGIGVLAMAFGRFHCGRKYPAGEVEGGDEGGNRGEAIKYRRAEHAVVFELVFNADRHCWASET